jgi:hypothetical protein
MVIRKLAFGLAILSLMVVATVGFNPAKAWATPGKKVDCDKVMSEIGAGKKTKDISKDLSISTSSVYRCKKKAGVTASAGASTTKPVDSTATPKKVASSNANASVAAAAATAAK